MGSEKFLVATGNPGKLGEYKSDMNLEDVKLVVEIVALIVAILLGARPAVRKVNMAIQYVHARLKAATNAILVGLFVAIATYVMLIRSNATQDHHNESYTLKSESDLVDLRDRTITLQSLVGSFNIIIMKYLLRTLSPQVNQRQQKKLLFTC